MNNKKSLAQMIATWSAEAVGTWGQDWPKISDHIAARYKALPPDEQQRLSAEASQTLLADQIGPGITRH